MEKKSIVVVSDVHAHPFKRFARTEANGLNSRLNYTLRCLREVGNVAKDIDAGMIWVAGDLFDAGNHTPVLTLNAVYQEVERWSSLNIPIVIVAGNHDFAVRSGDSTAIHYLRNIPNTSIVEEPEVFPMGDWNIHAIPYRDEMKEEWFEKDCPDTPSLCIAHGWVQGSALRKGYVPESDEAHEGKTGGKIPLHWLEPHTFSAVGHIHHAQKLAPNVLVPGMPYQQHPHESEEERGIWVVEFARDEEWEL